RSSKAAICRWCWRRNSSIREVHHAQAEIQTRAPEARPADGEGSTAPPPRVQESHSDQEASEAETAASQSRTGVARRRASPQAPADGIRSAPCLASRATSRA